MPARTEPALAARSRIGSACARWRLGALVLAACSLTTACFLNPKTDDLPRNVNGPGVVVLVPGGGDIGNSPGDDGEDLAPAYPEAPPNLGEPPSAAAPDAGSGASEDAFPADAGADLAFPFSHDGGLDAE